eukprot:CAMPEP_0202706664 /NCGR_PEP_ID=MMETSP1385-20130828/19055_1 /ASSEMBLY_ACC=CAM_ASM_000861 /TAXON_ID=933848 /ORGANISM="Elphidium margaritaceum" /LENGTH=160 /DNA_ID=CAMNT_0049365183 /DNA_START=16 /DNA_END=498 /DNA_ORIENTATION=-
MDSLTSSSAFKSLSKMSDKVQKYLTKKRNSKSTGIRRYEDIEIFDAQYDTIQNTCNQQTRLTPSQDTPIDLDGDFDPDDLMEFASNGGKVADKSTFLCVHDWGTVKHAVIKCTHCRRIVCTDCLKQDFNATDADIKGYTQRTRRFKCYACQVKDMCSDIH